MRIETRILRLERQMGRIDFRLNSFSKRITKSRKGFDRMYHTHYGLTKRRRKEYAAYLEMIRKRGKMVKANPGASLRLSRLLKSMSLGKRHLVTLNSAQYVKFWQWIKKDFRTSSNNGHKKLLDNPKGGKIE